MTEQNAATLVSTEQETIQISLVAHWQFCPRRAWLEAAGEKTDSGQMAAGTVAHKSTDDPRTARANEQRAVDLGHKSWGVSGRCDTIEEVPDGLILREYKATPVKRIPEVTEAMRLQLALQQACLQDMGHTVVGTEIYFTTHNKRVTVELDDTDLLQAEDAVIQTRNVVLAQQAPAPLEDSPKCTRCSHASVCLPDERQLEPITRRIRVADPDSQIVHLATPGARASVARGGMIVTKDHESLQTIPLERVQGLQVHGNIDISSGLMRELLWRGLSVLWCSGTGRVMGWSQSGTGPNGLQRVQQHVASAEGRLGLTNEFISAKIANQATQLRRAAGNSETVQRLRTIQELAKQATTWQQAVGYEGEAAAAYFDAWPHCFKDDLTE